MAGKLIIICGLSGSGKTTLAREVSRALNIVCLHKDEIKERLYDAQGLRTLEDSRRLGREVMDVLFGLVEEQCARGVDVMMEAPLNFSEDYAMFRRWERDYGTQIFSIICTVPERERYRRHTERAQTTRHAAHHDVARITEFATFTSDYDYATMPGAQLHVDTRRSTDDLVRAVVRHVEG